MIVNVIAWIILGAIAGWIAGYIMTRDTKLDLMDIVLGIVGAIVGGWLSRLVLDWEVETFSPAGVIVAVIGALILAFAYKFIMQRE